MKSDITGPCARKALFFSPNPARDLASPVSTKLATVTSACLRLTALATGCTVLAASTNATIAAQNLTGPDAILISALSAGVAIAAAVLPRSKRSMAAVLLVALIAGEGVNFLTSAERVIERRSSVSAVVTNSTEIKTAAQARLDQAQAELAAQRVNAANTAKTPDCAKQCRALLESQAGDLRSEVSAARTALERAPLSKSSTPLADKLGIAAWALDLTFAALTSLAVNLLAGALIAWSARPSPAVATTATQSATQADSVPDSVSPDRGGNAIADSVSGPSPLSGQTTKAHNTKADSEAAARRTRIVDMLKAGALEGRQVDIAAALDLPKTSLLRIVGSTPGVRLVPLAKGVSRLELVA